jgi:hypothetical protein
MATERRRFSASVRSTGGTVGPRCVGGQGRAVLATLHLDPTPPGRLYPLQTLFHTSHCPTQLRAPGCTVASSHARPRTSVAHGQHRYTVMRPGGPQG